jgi:hypothetical protein
MTNKATRFIAKDANGAAYSWFFRYDGLLKVWVLGDYTGYVRVLESNWYSSVPRIRTILENHGMTADIS